MRFSTLQVLSEDEIQQIHEASVQILECSGVLVYSEKALDLLRRNGADIDDRQRLARIPRSLLEKALKTVPETFVLYGRKGQKAFTVGDAMPKCASGHNAIFMVDAGTSNRRNSTVRDVEEFARISDQLEDIDIVGVPVMPQEVTPQASLIYAMQALFKNTTKPLFFSTESSAVHATIVQMMKAVAGREDISQCPMAISQLSPTSPLLWEEGAAEALMEASAEGIPLNLLPEPMTGVSAPYSVAGLLTMHNTEVLFGIVLSQLVRPGAPVIYGSSWTTYDMKYATAIIGSPETSLLRIAGCQMARHYHMPSHTTAPNSDSNAHDEQNAWEKTISNLCAICAGNDIVMNAGMFATGLTISHAQLVLDDEVNGIIRRLSRGIDVNADTIGAEVIGSVGPRGSFLIEDHTFNYLRSGEFRETKASNTMSYDAWISAGTPDAACQAEKKAQALLTAGNTCPLDDQVIRKMNDLIRAFESKC